MAENERVLPGKHTKVVDYAKLISVLKSKNPKELEANSWMFDLKDSKYLDKKQSNNVETMNEHVTYTSYPRCGNSFLRKYL